MVDVTSLLIHNMKKALSQESNSDPAKKCIKRHEAEAQNRYTEFIENEKNLSKKLLLIGAGEIGIEIGIAARNRGWFVRAICHEPDYPPPLNQNTPVPIRNLPYYTRSDQGTDETDNPKLQHLYYSGENCNRAEPFQWTVFKELEPEIIERIILLEMPDVVLLEDIFLTADEWKKLCSNVKGNLKGKKHIYFVPSPERMANGIACSDVLLSKIKMKEFLTDIGCQNNLLGEKDEYVDAECLREGIKSKHYGEEVKKIENALKRHGDKVILKFDMMSSGLGQIVLQDVRFINPEKIAESIKIAEHRIAAGKLKKRYYVIEKYLANKVEVSALVARTKEGKTIINRIYYKKDRMEQIRSVKYKGATRLITSETKTGDNALWIRLDKILERIWTRLRVPFIYVEFLLDPDKMDQPFINEISYRPDDAGFISCISHRKNQFTLFIESLESLLEKGEIKDFSNELEVIEPRGEYTCVTIVPGKTVRFLKDSLTWPINVEPTATNFKLSLYEKYLSTKGREVDYGRIVGYIWHRSGEKPEELLSEFKSSLGLDEKTFTTILETVSETE